MSKISSGLLAKEIREGGAWKNGARVVVLSESLAHTLHDELLRLELLETALRLRAANEREIESLLAQGEP